MAETSGLQTPLWRAIAVYRIAALVYVTILVVRNVGAYERPVLAWPVLAVTAGWTVFTTYAYADPARRRPPLLVADLLVTMAVMASSAWIVGAGALKDGKPTLAVAWHVAPVIAWAVAGGRRWGIAAAVAMGATDLVVRNHYDQAAYTVCSELFSIAQYGSTRSINAGVASGIAMHSWVRAHAGPPPA